MGIVRFIKPAVFLYEIVRLTLLAYYFMILLPSVDSIQWLAASPGALFPLMALFLWIDARRYKVYLPLYIAGKTVGVCALIVFSISAGEFTITKWFSGTASFSHRFFLCGDALAIACVLYVKRILNKPALTSMEDEQ